MKENSNGTLENVTLEVDFNLKDENIQILDVNGFLNVKM